MIKRYFKKIKTLFNHFLSLFYPKLCVVCQAPLTINEDYCCLHCLLRLPRTNYHRCPDNSASDKFLGKVPLQKVSSYLFYNKGGICQQLVAEIKYKGNRQFGEWMGTYLAKDMQASGFFQDVDYIVPVPLHKKKQKARGFNQSEALAIGIASVTGIPIDTSSLYRKIANPTQTRKSIYERWLNTTSVFGLKNKEMITDKHILLIDDVLTTGSTLEACVHCLLTCPGTTVSILTLAIAQ